MFKTQGMACVFTAKFWTLYLRVILWSIRVSIDHRKLQLICFLQWHGKSMTGKGFIFHWESTTCITRTFGIAFIVCVLRDNSYRMSQSADWNFDIYWKWCMNKRKNRRPKLLKLLQNILFYCGSNLSMVPFLFSFFLYMVMYDNEYKTKENNK